MIKTNIKNPDRVQKRQKQICRGAMKIFRKKGFHAASMRQIAKSSRIGLGNLYDYIEKKEDILFLVHKDILSQIYCCFDDIVKDYDSPVDQLVNVIREIFKLASQIREEVLFIYTETKSLEKKYLHEILEKESDFVSKFESLIQSGIRQGVFHCHNPALMANIITYNLSIVPLRGWNIPPGHNEDELLDTLIQFTLRGLGNEDEIQLASNKKRRTD